MSSSVPRAPVAVTCAWSRRLRCRYSVISRARFSLSTTASRSPGSGTPSRPRISTGVDGPAASTGWPRSLSSARARPHWAPATTRSPTFSVPRWTSTVATTPRPRSSLASMIVPCASRSGVGAHVEQLGLQLHRLDQLVEVGVLGGADRDAQHVAAEILEHDVVAEQLLLDPIRVGVGLVDLVDRHDHRHLGRLGVADRLDRLRHDAVVGRHHQDDDVGDRGAARAHRGERGVARRVDEGHRPAGADVDLVGADMLGDAAGLLGRDVGRAQRVQQRGLAVVDVAHDGHDRRARLQVLLDVGDALEALLDVGLADALHLVPELGHHQLGGIRVEALVDRGQDAVLHQHLDHLGATDRHAGGEILDGDGLGQDDLADDELGRTRGLTPLALALAAQGREAGAAALDQLRVAAQHQAVEPLGHGRRVAIGAARRRPLLDLAAARLAAVVARPRPAAARGAPAGARPRAPPPRPHRAAAGAARSSAGRGTTARLALLLAPLLVRQQLGGELLGLAAGLLLLAAARLLVGLALGRGFFLGAAARRLLGGAARILDRARARLLLGLAGRAERPQADRLLLLGQRLEHHRPPAGAIGVGARIGRAAVRRARPRARRHAAAAPAGARSCSDLAAAAAARSCSARPRRRRSGHVGTRPRRRRCRRRRPAAVPSGRQAAAASDLRDRSGRDGLGTAAGSGLGAILASTGGAAARLGSPRLDDAVATGCRTAGRGGATGRAPRRPGRRGGADGVGEACASAPPGCGSSSPRPRRPCCGRG